MKILTLNGQNSRTNGYIFEEHTYSICIQCRSTVAELLECLICDQEVAGSNLPVGGRGCVLEHDTLTPCLALVQPRKTS